MLVPSSVMISAPATSRLRMDSAMTASGMDLYHSSGVNWDVTMVDPRGSRSARMLSSWCAVTASIGVVRKSSRTNTSVWWRSSRNVMRAGSSCLSTARWLASVSVRKKRAE